MKGTPNKRLGVLVSHPIQYYAAWFRDLSQRLDLDVFYAFRQDAKGQASAGFGVPFDWDVPVLEGYRYEWLDNVSRNPGLGTFAGCDTPELHRIISRDRFDAFLVIGWNRKSSWQAIRACWRSGIPALMRGDSQLPMVSAGWKPLVKYLPYRYLLPKIDGHLYVGQRNKEYLEHYGVRPQQLFHCPHTVDNDFFNQRATEARESGRCHEIRDQLGIPANAFVALFVGKLIPNKNPIDFVRAVVGSVETSRPVHGVIVGSGPLEEECRQAAANCQRVHFAGFQNQTQVPSYYALADALVLCSDGTETWGLVVNEAMACGTPCIVSTDCGCSVDMIRQGESGFVFQRGDVNHLAKLLVGMSGLSSAEYGAFRDGANERAEMHSFAAASAGALAAISGLGGAAAPDSEHRAAVV